MKKPTPTITPPRKAKAKRKKDRYDGVPPSCTPVIMTLKQEPRVRK